MVCMTCMVWYVWHVWYVCMHVSCMHACKCVWFTGGWCTFVIVMLVHVHLQIHIFIDTSIHPHVDVNISPMYWQNKLQPLGFGFLTSARRCWHIQSEIVSIVFILIEGSWTWRNLADIKVALTHLSAGRLKGKIVCVLRFQLADVNNSIAVCQQKHQTRATCISFRKVPLQKPKRFWSTLIRTCCWGGPWCLVLHLCHAYMYIYTHRCWSVFAFLLWTTYTEIVPDYVSIHRYVNIW